MTAHETSVRSAGYFPSVARAVCSCGWRGEYRDLNTETGRVLVQLDKQNHTLRCRVCRGTGRDPMSDNVNWLPCTQCHGSGRASGDAA